MATATGKPLAFAVIAILFLLALVWGVKLAGGKSGAGCFRDLVCDQANLLTPAQRDQLSTYHQALLDRYDLDYRVVTGQADAGTSVRIFKEAAIGENSKTRRGLLLLVDPAGNLVRLEVSAGLDAVFTDGFVAYIEQRQMVPFFQANRVSDGILATTEMIVTRAQEGQSGKEFIPPDQLPRNLAIGAGAETKASIGTGYTAPAPQGKSGLDISGLSPQEVVALYHRFLAEGNAAPDLPVFSASSRLMRQQWVVTPAQMRNELNAYRNCTIDQTIYVRNKTLAVVRYLVEQRQCAPYFLLQEGGAWRIDFAEMMQSLRFNVDNEWHFEMKRATPYAAAFYDWSFNRDGYPFPRQKMRWGMTVSTNYRTGATYIERIYPDTPVASMGLRENDIIVVWGDLRSPDYRAVIENMDEVKAGQKIRVGILRDGQTLNVDLIAPPVPRP